MATNSIKTLKMAPIKKKSIVAFLLKMLESPIFLKPSGLREVFMKSFHLFPCIISIKVPQKLTDKFRQLSEHKGEMLTAFENLFAFN